MRERGRREGQEGERWEAEGQGEGQEDPGGEREKGRPFKGLISPIKGLRRPLSAL